MMPRKLPPQPSIDVWYKTSSGDIFEVVAVDPQEDAIEIQYLDGTVEELDTDTWQSVEPKVIDPPHEAMEGDFEEAGGHEEDYHDLVDLDSSDRDWAGLFDEYE
jgi:hypothetical protein